MSVTDQPAGPVIDGLGLTLDLRTDDLVSDAIVIAKVIGPDGIPKVVISDSHSLDWLSQYALIKAAERINDSQQFVSVDDEDD
ncbi:hypothetical protein [Sphaerisporangium sp. TRM90804]|uniref:hypothetical protein n=1 Tax=Sphaerisporangium sp. TRM90804 TaxID=3031113 RepID=UPI00244691DF|nr:hypothetical protein [Sphaerisporangium sp. TRM90804]MDH2424747.1 hypothetical protein [Sphaerisporangium sp. TRM90804]